jgi:hypothetical protein
MELSLQTALSGLIYLDFKKKRLSHPQSKLQKTSLGGMKPSSSLARKKY